jgi:hypothetical protein
MTWRRARKHERCGFCLDQVFQGGEPVFEYGREKSLRCAAVAKARYGVEVPVPVPFPEAAVIAPRAERTQDFVTAGELSRSSRFRRFRDVRQQQTGEQD